MADVAELLVAPAIAVNIVKAVNRLTGANSRQDAHVAALDRPTPLRQLLLILTIVTVTELLLYGRGI